MAAVHKRAKGTGSIQRKGRWWYVYSPESGGRRKLLKIEETRWAAERWLARWLEGQGLTRTTVGH